MRKYILTVFLVISLSTEVFPQKPQVWMLGPMLHFNFGNKQMHTSFGLEVAYWNYDKFPYSVDLGFEFEKSKFRLYSEAQTGIGFLGVSMGPVMELGGGEHKVKGGIQGSGWLNYFGGIDLRFRAVGGASYFSPGVYFKLPLGLGDSDGHYHHWDDWD